MANVLETLSEAMAEAVESAGASVVQVAARRRLPASGIVWSADGVIVTSHHVIEHDEKIRVGLPNGHIVRGHAGRARPKHRSGSAAGRH